MSYLCTRKTERTNAGAVVQLVRIPACHAGGRGFESRPLRQQISEESDTKRQVFRKMAKTKESKLR